MGDFHLRLKEIRKNIKVTQKQAALNMGIAENQYQSYELGRSKPSYEIIIKLCQYFNISADYLLGLSNNPTPLRKNAP